MTIMTALAAATAWGCCSGLLTEGAKASCSGNSQTTPGTPLLVELLALDLQTCGRCTGTEASVEAAVAELQPILAEAGVRLEFRRTVVKSAEQAIAERFLSSPTIRINGRDLPVALNESACTDCGELCAGQTPGQIACRVWSWAGKDYTAAPKGLVLDAILKEYAAAGRAPSEPENARFELPENLTRFFLARSDGKNTQAAPCCASDGAPSAPKAQTARPVETAAPGAGAAPCCDAGGTARKVATTDGPKDKPCCGDAVKTAEPCCGTAKPAATPCCGAESATIKADATAVPGKAPCCPPGCCGG